MALLIDEFSVGSDKQTVFKILLMISKNRYPNMMLAYRDGRRADDPFSSQSKNISEALIQTIHYSNEWRIFLYGRTANEKNINSNQTVSFRFLDNTLLAFNKVEALLPIAVELSQKQLALIEFCQLFIHEIHHQITDPLGDESWRKMSGAYTTGFCVVGKDMQRGLAIVEHAMKAIDLTAINSIDEFLESLTYQVSELVREQDYVDAEGFIAGTIKEVLVKARKLKAKFVESAIPLARKELD